MTARLSTKDSIKNWVNKINEAIEQPHVDGNFSISETDFQTRNIEVSGGVVRYDSEIINIPSYSTTLAPGYTFVIGIDLQVEEIIAYELDEEPNTLFIPMYIITTNSISVSSFSDLRSWSLVSSAGTGDNTERPSVPRTGFMYFDTSLGYPIWWNGSAWVDSTGTAI